MATGFNDLQIPDQYQAGPGPFNAVIQGQYLSGGGYAVISTNDVFVELQAGGRSREVWGQEFHVPVGGLQINPGTTGIRFRNFAAGSPAIVTCWLFGSDEPVIIILSTGQSTKQGVASINFQHNDIAVATENTIDFEDGGGVTWTITDDPANTRVKVAAAVTSTAPTTYRTADITAANTDIPTTGLTSGSINTYAISPNGGGTVRSIANMAQGTRIRFVNFGSAPVTFLHQTAGGAGDQLFILPLLANYILPPRQAVEFYHDSGTTWVCSEINNGPQPYVYYSEAGNPAKSIVTSATETDLFGTQGSGISIAGRTMGLTGALHVDLVGDVQNLDAANQINFTIRVYYGGSVFGTPFAPIFARNNIQPIVLFGRLANLNATNAQIGTLNQWPTIGGAGLASGYTPSQSNQQQLLQTLAIDSTIAQTFRITCQATSGTSANYQVRIFSTKVSVYP